MSAHPDSLLVTGAGGQLGQRVLAHLLDTLQLPPQRIVALTRRPETLAAWAARGVDVRPGDFDAPTSLDAAFQGVGRLLLISTDALDRPGHRLEQHRAAIAAAARAGVRHVVYTSCPEPYASPLLLAADHAGTEDALAASALPGWTVLRNHWYFENLFMSLPSTLASGHWYSAAEDGRIAHIARDDLARAAAVALAADSDDTRTLTLSGARAYTTAEIAALVAQTVGKPIEVVPVPVEGLVQGMVGAGLPEPLARILASFDSNTAVGRAAAVTGDYQALTGQAPQPFEQWLQANRAQLAALAP
ncbi:NAD(P)H-binding protein [Xanthomonas sp. NCPPB 2654]|uniref:NmrA family NAD(P)-binding protein n=1 Tax=unclassified Xanthomonas TaxID=2643310 RepID=UPI0021E0F4ED|nr:MULTISPECIES: NAD(P)H-binding protein [unclassified Xanthomonas]MDL5366030.1 NAD(P)H-binding protein [Xanthomonas sp. NCPPB 2654]UYC20729.1 NAD(P)H-binding protein [Xanthomonas sp. CFBP 8443]